MNKNKPKQYINIDFTALKESLKTNNLVGLDSPNIQEVFSPEPPMSQQIADYSQQEEEQPSDDGMIPFGIEGVPMQQPMEPQGGQGYVPEYDPNQHMEEQQSNEAQYMQDGGFTGSIPRFPDGGAATTSDSLDVYNNAIKINAYYENLRAKGWYKKPTDKVFRTGIDLKSKMKYVKEESIETLKRNIDNASINSSIGFMGYNEEIVRNAYPSLSGKKYLSAVKKSLSEIEKGGGNKYYYKDLLPSVIDPMAPSTLIDTRINPQFQRTYEMKNTHGDIRSRTPPGGGWTEAYSYDPIAVKPYNMLTPEERRVRDSRYGDETPIRYRDPAIVARQQQLIDAGYDIGTADGIWGRNSIRAWDEMNASSINGDISIPGEHTPFPNQPTDLGFNRTVTRMPTPPTEPEFAPDGKSYYSIGTNSKGQIVFNTGEVGKMNEMSIQDFYKFKNTPEFGKYKELNPKPHLYQMLQDPNAGYFPEGVPEFQDGGVAGYSFKKPTKEDLVNNLFNRKPTQPQPYNNNIYGQQSSIPQKYQDIPQNIKEQYAHNEVLREQQIIADRFARMDASKAEGDKGFFSQDLGVVGQAIPDKMRNRIEPNFYDDYLNPFVHAGHLLSLTGQSMSKFSQGNVLGGIADAGTVMGMGLMGNIGARGTGQWANNIVNPIAGFDEAIAKKVGNKFASSVDDVSKGFKSEIDWAKWNKEIPDNPQLMKEYNAIEQTSKANGAWMKNPDGSKFTGTPEQFVQQNSENFKKAFPEGSDVSYRGDLSKISELKSQQELGKEAIKRKYNLNDNDIEALEKLWERNKDKLNSGKYTTNDYEAALKYSKGNADNVLHLYTDIRNPKFTETGESFRVLEKDRQKLLSEGYDALITKPSSLYPEGENVLLRNNQIKSAIGNNGMFDMTNPNIYKSVIGAIGTGAALNQTNNNKSTESFKNGGIAGFDFFKNKTKRKK